jgi:hypothetical protein
VPKTQAKFVDFALMKFIDFNNANFRIATSEAERLGRRDTLLRSLVYRPTIFQRNDIRWIAAHAWRSGAKERGVTALKLVKQHLDPLFIREAAQPIAALICDLRGPGLADAVTCVPCGHSRRPDCFGKRLAQAVAEVLGVPFMQIFADRPCSGVSHPKRSVKLPPLEQIVNPPRSIIVVDDVATSGGHLEQAVLALRRLGVAASAVTWISGSSTGGAPFRGGAAGSEEKGMQPRSIRTAPGVVELGGRGGKHVPSGLSPSERAST